jgi:hypothetical protein
LPSPRLSFPKTQPIRVFFPLRSRLGSLDSFGSTLLLPRGPSRSRKVERERSAANPRGYSRETSRVTPRTHALSPRRLCACRQREAPRLSRKIHLLLAKVQSLVCHCVATPVRPPNVWAGSDLRGKRLKPSRGDDLCEPGPGVWPLRLVKRQRWGTAAPAHTHCWQATRQVQGSSAHQRLDIAIPAHAEAYNHLSPGTAEAKGDSPQERPPFPLSPGG